MGSEATHGADRVRSKSHPTGEKPASPSGRRQAANPYKKSKHFVWVDQGSRKQQTQFKMG